MRFKIGDKVVVVWSGKVGVVHDYDGRTVYLRHRKRRLQGPDDAGYRYTSVHEDQLIPHSWVRPGIGAVVAMVAAMRWAAGDWARLRHRNLQYAHRMIDGSYIAAWCGADVFPDPELDIDGVCTGVREWQMVTCPDCLEMHERVYGTEGER